MRAITIAVAMGLVLAACSTPAPEPVAPPAPQVDPMDFSSQRAWEHLKRLTAIGPRASGTPGAERARSYIRSQLESYGLKVTSLETDVKLDDGTPIDLVTLIATIPGGSTDLFVLAAPYDTRYFAGFEFVGANGGASGPALLLELARVLSLRPLAYTTWVVFLDGEAPLGRGTGEESTTAWIGSSELARIWDEEDRLDSIRLLVYVDQVADADLSIARDLRSHRSYRETFWDNARRLGHADAFAPARRYESPVAGHVPFLARGLRRSVLIMDTSYGGDEPPGIYADTEDDTIEHCSPASLGAVGEITLQSVEEIAGRLAKIDRFADAPLREPTVSPAPVPPAPERTLPTGRPPGGAQKPDAGAQAEGAGGRSAGVNPPAPDAPAPAAAP